MIHEVDFLRFSFTYSFSSTHCFFYFPCFLISVHGMHPFSHPCSKEILEKSGVVVMAAKLTSSASPYPFSFIIHRFIQYAYVPIVHLSTSLSRSSYPFPHSSLRESSIPHHTHLPLIHSPSNFLAYMESHGACHPSLLHIPIKTTHSSPHVHTTHTYPSCHS